VGRLAPAEEPTLDRISQDTVSAAVRHDDVLYVSTLTGDAILRLPVPD